ncbi:uncharacterized protein BCR38DRAFT_416603 [Pseudomassariella vexata]|uniref:Ysc84 actin-binding domain-containing protein n=1 Tax=Pseudomassariella vexata TaxID=1141098 RepID=A0A1Y2EIF8_9PEZI|nr:uncharacterized protein BCR38DRAFT_416603 [Pseudomassariella vexata]ORY71372.1 hypothetical protein BCR38DRAFT_416603 [Pseudomassariella vexata]
MDEHPASLRPGQGHKPTSTQEDVSAKEDVSANADVPLSLRPGQGHMPPPASANAPQAGAQGQDSSYYDESANAHPSELPGHEPEQSQQQQAPTQGPTYTNQEPQYQPQSNPPSAHPAHQHQVSSYPPSADPGKQYEPEDDPSAYPKPLYHRAHSNPSSAHPNHQSGQAGNLPGSAHPENQAASILGSAEPEPQTLGSPKSAHAAEHTVQADDNPPDYHEDQHGVEYNPLSVQDEKNQQTPGYFPPPPPGPPPSDQKHAEQFYPPPPPGPPPNQSQAHPNPLKSHPYEDASTDAPPPGYSPPPPGFHVPSDAKPPALPPRRSPSQGQSSAYVPAPAPGPGSHSAVPPTDHQAQASGSHVPAAAAAGVGLGAGTGAGAGAPSAGADGKTKKGFGERLYQWGVKAGVPINKVTNKLGSEAFWPTTMDKECDKGARILKSFCKDGFYTSNLNYPPPSPGHPTTPGPSTKGKALVKIPPKAVQQAKGIAIFTTLRTGLHISGAGGSGIVVARLPDGSWSPPSGFLVHTLGAGFMVGLDIYDCVCVLNTEAAVQAFIKPRLSLGGEVAVVAGPIGAGASLEGALKGGKPVWSYMKSRGFYAGVQADGTIIIERPGANADFYGEKVSVEQILKGKVKDSGPLATGKDGVVMWPTGAKQLMEVLRAAEGKSADETVLGQVAGPTPGDLAGTEGVHKEKDEEMQGGVKFA